MVEGDTDKDGLREVVVVLVDTGHEQYDMAVDSGPAAVDTQQVVVEDMTLAEGGGEPCLVAEDISRSKKAT